MAYASLLTRNSAGLNPNFRGLRRLRNARSLRGLGACVPNWSYANACQQGVADTGTPTTPSPQDAMGTAINNMCNNTGTPCNCDDFQNCSWYGEALDQVENGQMNLAWFSPTCAGIVAPNVNVFQTDSGLALGTTSAGTGLLAATGVIGASTAALLGAVTMGVGAIVAVIATIFAHHAAAAKQEQDVGCTSLAAVNNAMEVIATAVKNGTMTPSDAATAVGEIYPAYYSYINQAGVFGTSPMCNANCEMSVIVQAMDIYWQGQYNLLASQQSAAAAQVVATSPSVATAPVAVASNAPEAAQTNPTAGAGVAVTPAAAAGAYPAVTVPASSSGLSSDIEAIPSWAWILGLGLAIWAVA
jgi:hypothetical protein